MFFSLFMLTDKKCRFQLKKIVVFQKKKKKKKKKEKREEGISINREEKK